jgi:rod shape-determining protein MreD
VFKFFAISGVRPDLPLIITLYAAFKYGSMERQVTGFIAGLGMDSFSSHLFGVNAFTKTLIGFTAGAFRKKIYSENILVVLVYIFIASCFNGIIFLILNKIFLPQAVAFWDYIVKVLLLEIVYNCVVGVMMFALFEKMDRAFRRA